MKILFLSHAFYPAIGGIESNSEVICDELAKQGHHIHLVTTTVETGEKAFPYVVIRNPGLLMMIKEMRWAEVIFENNPNVRLTWPNVLVQKPMVTALHTWIKRLDGSVGLPQKLKIRWLGFSKALIACSSAVRKETHLRAIVIGNPYNNFLFRRKPEIEKTLDFVFLGRLVSDKGVTLAVKAFKRFLDTVPGRPSNLTIIGNGAEKEALLKEVHDLHLEDAVHFAGSLRGEALADLLNAHKYLLVPSVWEEPFGMVVLEGMACACIPIVSNGGGLPDAVGKAGLIFEKGSVDDLYLKMMALDQDPALREELRRGAAAHLKNHQAPEIARQYANVLKSVL